MIAREFSCRAAAIAADGISCHTAEHQRLGSLAEIRSDRNSGCLSDWATPDMSLVRDEYHAPLMPKKILRDMAGLAQDMSDAVGAPIDYVVGPMFASAAACVGNARAVRANQNWSEPCIWWHASIGDPSSGKSPGQSIVTKALVTIDREKRAQWRKQYDQCLLAQEKARTLTQLWRAEVRKALRDGSAAPPLPKGAQEPGLPAPFRLVLADFTPQALEEIAAGNPRGVLCKRDELNGVLGSLWRFGAPTGPLLLSGFNGVDHDVSRAGGKSLVIHRLNISMTGPITPDDWSALLARGNDGLLPRFCAVRPEPVGLPAANAAPDVASLERVYRRLLGLKLNCRQGVPNPKELPLSQAAQALHREWHAEHHNNGYEEGYIGAHYGKLPGIALRLALLLELIWWAYGNDESEPQVVTDVAMAASLGAIEAYYKPMALRVYGLSGASPKESHARTLAKHIVRHRLTVINCREIRRSAQLPGLRTDAAVKDVISELTDAAWVRPTQYLGRGRPRGDFEVNPLVFAMEEAVR